MLFFTLFWFFSVGFYLFMQHSFGPAYFARVKERLLADNYTEPFIDQGFVVTERATDVALEHIQDTLILVNGILLVVIPTVSYVLARESLSPIYQSHEKQRQFISDASHELRTPLAIIESEIDVTLKKSRPKDYYTGTLSNIREEVGRLTRLVTDLLVLAKQESGRYSLTLQPVDIVDVVMTRIAAFETEFRKKKIAHDIRFPEESCIIPGNEDLLNQLFSNLIDNALKFSPSKSTIRIIIGKARTAVTVVVADEGTGVPKEYQKRIFDRFYRADQSRSGGQGFGLGLSIVKAITELHHGQIYYQDRIPKGSMFTVRLPLYK